MSRDTDVAANKEILHRAASIFGPERFEEYLHLYAENAQLHFLPPGCLRAARRADVLRGHLQGLRTFA